MNCRLVHPLMNCRICTQQTAPSFETCVLAKYQVSYFQCAHCGFIQTEEPYWLPEAYSSAMTKLDVGLVGRNHFLAQQTERILLDFFNPRLKFLDYGGGYGLFVRMLRDRGIDFYRQDRYCQNIFAEYFDLEDLPEGSSFELITAFEVFEHLIDPTVEVERMLALSDAILFSTALQPEAHPTPASWWYFIPETGQHVSLYSRKSLEIMAERFHCQFYTDGSNLHLFSRRTLLTDPFPRPSRWEGIKGRLKHRLFPDPLNEKSRLGSLLDHDLKHIRSKIS